MNKIADKLVNLGLLSTEYVTDAREPSELGAFERVDSGQQQEILTSAEQVVLQAAAIVQQTPSLAPAEEQRGN